jgi:hypothetical protein
LDFPFFQLQRGPTFCDQGVKNTHNRNADSCLHSTTSRY